MEFSMDKYPKEKSRPTISTMMANGYIDEIFHDTIS